jgi:hypothetical protein
VNIIKHSGQNIEHESISIQGVVVIPGFFEVLYPIAPNTILLSPTIVSVPGFQLD